VSTRREFLQAGGALSVCFAIPACSQESGTTAATDLNIGNRLRIFADGHIELLLGKVELGQGIGTALVQIAAEELGVRFDRIVLAPVDTQFSPDESYTFSSISIQQSGTATRRAAAAAREFLLRRAADQLDVRPHKLAVEDGEVLMGAAITGINYWQLLDGESAEISVSDEQATKSFEDYEVVGKSYPRIDIPGKVFGKQSYLQDLRLPQMVHARVIRPDSERAEIEHFDTEAVDALPGVLSVIRDGNFVAIVASREDQVRRAAAVLRNTIKWKFAGDMPDENSIFDWLKSAKAQTETVAEHSIGADERVPTERVSASYQRPYQAHASISPSAAVALYEGGELTVWSHAQGMYPLREAIAAVLGLDIDKVRCRHLEASGCYGHNGGDDAACDAAAIAVHYPGRPIRLQWERSDEMAWEPYGSAMHIDVGAGVDDEGNIRQWEFDLWSTPHSSRPRSAASAGGMIYAQHKKDPLPLPPIQSIPQPNGGADRNAIPLYAFDEVTVRKHLLTEVPIRVSALRSLGAYANVFAIESFMDELAARAKVDPLAYRLRHLQDERALAVLQKLADLGNWEQRRGGDEIDGWGLGFARFKNRSSYLGVIARVAADTSAKTFRVKSVTAVCDAGLIVNPDGVRAQIEGGIVQSCSWTLKERVRFDQQRKRSLDWATYPILRFDEVPTIDVALMSRDDQPALGVGESAQGPTAAAIANAICDATGQRLRALPLQLT
jgi:nicotinate dehydrogenase subunit B